MEIQNKTKEELIIEIQELRQQYDFLKEDYDIAVAALKRPDEQRTLDRANSLKTFRSTPIGLTTLDRDTSVTEINNPAVFETQCRAKDGTCRNIEINGISVGTDERNHLYALARNISDGKRAEEDLKKNLSLTDAILQSIQNGILVIDQSGKVLKTNSRFAEMWNIPQQILDTEDDKMLLDFILEQLIDPYDFISKVNDLYRNPEAESLDFVYFKDGRIYERTSRPMFIGGKPEGRVWSFFDVTERVQADKALIRSEELFSLFFAQSYMGFYFMMIDEPFEWNDTTEKDKTLETVFENLKFTKVNQAFLDQYHATESDFIGKSLNDQFREKPERGRKAWYDLLDKGEKIRLETNELTIDGQAINIEGDYICMYDEKGRIFGIFGVQMDMTSSKLATSALHESETNLNAVFNATDESILLLSADTTILEMNEESARRLGGKREDLIGHKAAELLPSAVMVRRQLLIDKAISTGEQLNFEDERDGRWTSNHLFPILNSEGKVIRMAIFSNDITLRKQAEKAVKENEIKYKALYEGANDGIIILDEDILIDCNQKIESIFRQNKKDLLGHSILDFSPVEQPDGQLSAKKVKEINTALAVDGTPQLFEWINCRADGTFFNAEVSLNRVELSGKIFIQAIVRDITERKKAEEALYVSESKLHAIIDNSSDAIGVHIDGIWEMCNPAAVQLFRVSGPEQLLGTPILNVIIPEERQRIRDYVKNRITNDEAPTLYITQGLRTDGTIFDMDVALSSYILEGKRHVLVTLRDITEQKQMEAEIKKTNEELKKSNAEKDKFFSIIGHDLRNPFNSILGFSELLIENVNRKNYDVIGKYSLIINQSSKHALDLLINLLEWSRSQTGLMNFNPEYLEIVNLIDEIVLMNKEIAEQKSIALITEFPTHAMVYADSAMISTVLRNLISNAIKFTKPNGQIIISIIEKQKKVTCSVSDSGIGINKDRIGKLFSISESQSTSGTNNEKGTGLGLILCKEFIEKHGGEIWVESEVGIGSTFSFTVPANA